MAMKAPAGIKPLTAKEQLFVDEFMVDRNASAAYVRAGYSPKGANGHAARLVAKGSISAEIGRRVEEYSRLAGIDKVWVLERMKAAIDAELPDLFDDNGALLPPKAWPKHMKSLVQSVKTVEMQGGAAIGGAAGIVNMPMYTKEVKLEPKLPTLAKLLDFVGDAPPTAVNVTQNVQVNADRALIELRELLAK
jgi:hypothetical protein